ncbi:hypothetical protein [uncultured Treponema sp.]|uniref:hypothetical protein n=1 Tax=uncultured Treponema sp. TaxID=162155 RepID=UPI0025CD387C|nr:hypothetical protein [uncultured Treponema sp.]
MAVNSKDRNPADLWKVLKGRTADQQKVIKYFWGYGGCLSKCISDSEYDLMVQKIATGTDWKQRALNKIGLDEDQLKEIDPIHFEGYYYDDKDSTYAKYGRADKKWRSSAYQISWLFFSEEQVYLYQYTFNMDEDGKSERTEEYFYKDITNFSSSTDTVEKDVPEISGCNNKVEFVKKPVDYTRFALVVPGDKLYCSMDQSDEYEASIQGMKAKLREKKNA